MPLTLEEAKEVLRRNNWPESEPMTPQALKAAGWEPGSVLGDIPAPAAAFTPEELRDAAALAIAEAEANQLPAQAMGYLKQAVGMALALK